MRKVSIHELFCFLPWCWSTSLSEKESGSCNFFEEEMKEKRINIEEHNNEDSTKINKNQNTTGIIDMENHVKDEEYYHTIL